ncbi:hydroxyacid dehydrogenase [soil metagenome]
MRKNRVRQKERGILITDDLAIFGEVWCEKRISRLRELVDLPEQILTSHDLERHADWLADTEVIFSTWGMPSLTTEQLALFPKLRAVFYAAGSVKLFAQPMIDRGILVLSAASANAIPVAEFTLSQILFGLKSGWAHVRQFREKPGNEGWRRLAMAGVYQSTVGVISLGLIGRSVCDLLEPFSVRKLVYDPFISLESIKDYRVQSVGLPELFSLSDVVTVHTPWLEETEGLITGDLLRRMKPYATFINTSRGALVNEPELIEVMRERPDLTAVLDVAVAEPPHADSALLTLPNVVLTPHIAGSFGNERLRMADDMIEEFKSWRDGLPLRFLVSLEDIVHGA